MSKLTEAVELSQSILELAKKEDWEVIEQVASKRQNLLEQYFSQTNREESDTVVGQAIQQILSLDAESQQHLANQQKTEISQSLNLKNKYKVAQAYAKNQ